MKNYIFVILTPLLLALDITGSAAFSYKDDISELYGLGVSQAIHVQALPFSGEISMGAQCRMNQLYTIGNKTHYSASASAKIILDMTPNSSFVVGRSLYADLEEEAQYAVQEVSSIGSLVGYKYQVAEDRTFNILFEKIVPPHAEGKRNKTLTQTSPSEHVDQSEVRISFITSKSLD